MKNYIMFNPPHPGEVLKEDYIEILELTVTDTAKALCISRKNLSEIINGHTGISPEMAMRLSKAFSTSPQFWLNIQMTYDLWQVYEKREEILSNVEQLFSASNEIPEEAEITNLSSS